LTKIAAKPHIFIQMANRRVNIEQWRLRSYAVSTGKYLPTFRRSAMPNIKHPTAQQKSVAICQSTERNNPEEWKRFW
jgi:hypothetical protein